MEGFEKLNRKPPYLPTLMISLHCPMMASYKQSSMQVHQPNPMVATAPQHSGTRIVTTVSCRAKEISTGRGNNVYLTPCCAPADPMGLCGSAPAISLCRVPSPRRVAGFGSSLCCHFCPHLKPGCLPPPSFALPYLLPPQNTFLQLGRMLTLSGFRQSSLWHRGPALTGTGLPDGVVPLPATTACLTAHL